MIGYETMRSQFATANLRSQIVTSSSARDGGGRYRPNQIGDAVRHELCSTRDHILRTEKAGARPFNAAERRWSQIVTASKRNVRYLPYALTEHGALMAATFSNCRNCSPTWTVDGGQQFPPTPYRVLRTWHSVLPSPAPPVPLSRVSASPLPAPPSAFILHPSSFILPHSPPTSLPRRVLVYSKPRCLPDPVCFQRSGLPPDQVQSATH